jgi:hypothetical protein
MMLSIKTIKYTTHLKIRHTTIHNSQVMETAKMPHYRRMDQENVVFIHNGILLSHEEE